MPKGTGGLVPSGSGEQSVPFVNVITAVTNLTRVVAGVGLRKW